MTDESVLIENIPDVSDINVLLEAISVIGAIVERIDRHTVRISGATIGSVSVDYEFIKKIRASLLSAGELCSASIRRRRYLCPGAATSAAVPSTSI